MRHTMHGVRLEAHRDRTVRMVTFMAGTFNVSNSVGGSFFEQDGLFLRRNLELKMRTVCDTTSQESITMAVVRLEAKERQCGLDRHVRGGHVDRLKHDLSHALTVDLGVQGVFRESKKGCFSGAILSSL